MLATLSPLGPALGNICLNYLPPLVVADLIARVVAGEPVARR